MRHSEEGKIFTEGVEDALVATAKTVVVEVAESDLQALKESGYRLCFSKQGSGEIFDVIWQAYAEFLSTNVFGWDPTYEIFCTNSFEVGGEIRSTTNFVEIEFGQQSTLDANGFLSSPSSGENDSAITLINEYGGVYPGLSQYCVGIENETSIAPIFVSETAILTGSYDLVTTDEVMVWFEQSAESGTMFETPSSNNIVADLTSYDRVTLLYEEDMWSLVGSE